MSQEEEADAVPATTQTGEEQPLHESAPTPTALSTTPSTEGAGETEEKPKLRSWASRIRRVGSDSSLAPPTSSLEGEENPSSPSSSNQDASPTPTAKTPERRWVTQRKHGTFGSLEDLASKYRRLKREQEDILEAERLAKEKAEGEDKPKGEEKQEDKEQRKKEKQEQRRLKRLSEAQEQKAREEAETQQLEEEIKRLAESTAEVEKIIAQTMDQDQDHSTNQGESSEKEAHQAVSEDKAALPDDEEEAAIQRLCKLLSDEEDEQIRKIVVDTWIACQQDEEATRKVLIEANRGLEQELSKAKARIHPRALDKKQSGNDEEESDEEEGSYSDTDSGESEIYYECNNCSREMDEGEKRYHCTSCEDFDLCARCLEENRANPFHEHQFFEEMICEGSSLETDINASDDHVPLMKAPPPVTPAHSATAGSTPGSRAEAPHLAASDPAGGGWGWMLGTVAVVGGVVLMGYLWTRKRR